MIQAQETKSKQPIKNPASPLKKINPGKIAGMALIVALICGLGGAVYFLLKERTRAIQGFETKLAQLESRVQILQNWRSNSPTPQYVESLRRDLQNFKEQTAEQFIKEERFIQELQNIRPLPAAAPRQNTPAVEPEIITNQTTELLPPAQPEPGKPVEIKREPPSPPERSKETQGFIDFMETLVKNFIAIAKEVFYKIFDLLYENKGQA